MIRGHVVVVALVTATALAGCSRLGYGDGPSRRTQPVQQQAWEPLPAAPAGTVTQETLQPLPPAPGAAPGPGLPPPVDPMAPQPPTTVGPAPVKPTQVTEVAPDKGMAIGRGDFSGGWTLSSGTDTCQLFANLTTWAGGYRATSRGCASPDLQKITAWSLADNKITLKGSDGSTVATLTQSAKERFVGQTSARQPITVSR
jgi:hypothetical protein